ncbi:MAG: MCE family protein [Jatrophihabitantaceae bacterium]
MRKLAAKLTRLVVGVVVLAVVAGVAVYLIVGGGGSKTVTANFASAVGVYPGTPVEILGIPVGSVTKVSPRGDSVAIEMQYDSKYNVPANAISVIVANSLVSDRYVQLAPAYSGQGATLASGATIPTSRTASPAELDDIYAALNKLSSALGPNGANKSGSLNTLVKVAAANLKGNGANLGNSIDQLSKAAATLSNGRQDLFGTVKNLQAFTQALSDSDAQVRHFQEQLAQVAGDLANERADLGSALHNLSGALNAVAGFVKANQRKFHTDIGGLKTITDILVREKAALEETFSVAPVALANVVHLYQPDLGVLGTRSNLSELTDPTQLCGLLTAVGLGGTTGPLGILSQTLSKVLGPLSKVCTTLIKKASSGGLLGSIGGIIGGLLGGGIKLPHGGILLGATK